MEETYYLIDFENVGLKGLEGAQKLTAQDHVHLFSTRNAPKFTTAVLANFNGTNLQVHEVPAKSQSIDMHLVSYLGYLLGTIKPDRNFVILSNDTDYDDIVQFWQTELGADIKRRDKFEAPKPPTAAVPAGKSKAAQKKPSAAVIGKAEKSPGPEDRTAVNNAVMKTLGAAGFDTETVGYAASQVTKLFSEKNGKQLIYRSIISKYGQERGLEIYRQIKKLL